MGPQLFSWTNSAGPIPLRSTILLFDYHYFQFANFLHHLRFLNHFTYNPRLFYFETLFLDMVSVLAFQFDLSPIWNQIMGPLVALAAARCPDEP